MTPTIMNLVEALKIFYYPPAGLLIFSECDPTVFGSNSYPEVSHSAELLRIKNMDDCCICYKLQRTRSTNKA